MGKLSFGTTGLSYQVDKVNIGQGGSPTCQRCSQKVYFNEEKRAIGKVWHVRCFTCAKCKKSLDSTNCSAHEGEVFCAPCHRREFGPKGYGFAGGAAGLSTESSVRKLRPVTQVQTTTVPATITSDKINTEDPNNCPRCGKRVYFAEEIKALHRNWHKLCFKCCECNKPLQPGGCNEHGGRLFCGSCYGRHYGPRGYGFAGGAGTLLSSEVPKYNDHRLNGHIRSPSFQKSESRVNGDYCKPVQPGNKEWTEAVYI